ncbi:MAG: hypothetical protein AMXMBFR61_24530 [Fimbriimonadales bacterium]
MSRATRTPEKSDPVPKPQGSDDTPVVAIVGNPNVGKSVLFNRLTGAYVTVSNYPGTTVEVCRGCCRLGGRTIIVFDTPGMYGLCPCTEEERVARRLLAEGKPDLLLHVVDVKNLKRMLPLTVQLVEAGFKVVLVLNMMDELEKTGMRVDVEELRAKLGIPVVPTSCLHGRGLCALQEEIDAHLAS